MGWWWLLAIVLVFVTLIHGALALIELLIKPIPDRQEK
jgi:hypothetical protein